MWRTFWSWYRKYHTLNVVIATGAFLLQIVHLYWLAAHVIALRVVGVSFFILTPLWEIAVVLIDYLEIPSLIGVSLIYIHDVSERFSWRPFVFLFLVNTQWLHLFWITDAFVVESFTGSAAVAFPVWLAWVAILIDYLEVPVMWDTGRKALHALRGRKATS